MTFKLPRDLEEFTDVVKSTINNKFLYESKAEGWGEEFDGRILIHVRPEDNLPEDIFLLANLYDGECRGIDVFWGDEPDEYGFAFRGDYSDWRELLLSHSKRSLSDGTFDMEGDLRPWMEYKDANYMRIDVAQEIPTEFEK